MRARYLGVIAQPPWYPVGMNRRDFLSFSNARPRGHGQRAGQLKLRLRPRGSLSARHAHPARANPHSDPLVRGLEPRRFLRPQPMLTKHHAKSSRRHEAGRASSISRACSAKRLGRQPNTRARAVLQLSELFPHIAERGLTHGDARLDDGRQRQPHAGVLCAQQRLPVPTHPSLAAGSRMASANHLPTDLPASSCCPNGLARSELRFSTGPRHPSAHPGRLFPRRHIGPSNDLFPS